MSTMLERLKVFAFGSNHCKGGCGGEEEFCHVDMIRFAEAEVRAALAPREQIPGLANAEKRLRIADGPDQAEIVEELDRLRVENARLKEEAERLRTSERVAADLLADVEDHMKGEGPNSVDELLARIVLFWDTNGEKQAQPSPAQTDDRATRAASSSR